VLKPSRRALVLIASLSVGPQLGVISQAQAQTEPAPTPVPSSAPAGTPSAADVADAKRYFQAGLRFYKDGHLSEALAAFMAANRLAPRESIQRNIAQTYRDMRDFASAHQAYSSLLSAYGDKMKPQDKMDAERALAELAALTGVVSVTITEPGATVLVDGKEEGQTPLARPIRLNVGAHTVTVTKPGFDPIETRADVAGNETFTVTGPLVKTVTTGHVSITVTPADSPATVLVDGAEVGPAPWQGDLSPGTHTVAARSAAGSSPATPVEVTLRGAQELALTIRRPEGALSITVDVFDAAISVDGKVLGNGRYEGWVPAGDHVIEVSSNGFVPLRKTITVQDNGRTVESIHLERVAEAPKAQGDPWRGVYARVDFMGVFPVSEENNVASGDVYGPEGAREEYGFFGGGLGLRIGYSFGLAGIELGALATYDHTGVKVDDPELTGTGGISKGRTDDWGFHRLGGTFGIVGRLMPKTDVVRPTLGLGVGFSAKWLSYKRDIQGSPVSEVSDATSYVAPALIMDAGLQLGNTPGTRLYLGAMLLVEFASAQAMKSSFPSTVPEVSLPAGAAVSAATSTEVFFGPVLGVTFGH
jgi:hypothetical protein